MKKLIAMSLAIIICLSMSFSALAIEMRNDEKHINGVIPENPISIAEQIQRVRNNENYSKEKKEQVISEILEKGRQDSVTRSVSSTPEITLSGFTYYYQQRNYWCVPACIKMALKYINGSADTQATIADAIGVNDSSGVPLSEAVPYLNNKQSNATYTQIWTSSVSVMKDDFYAILADEDAPAIICTIFTTAEGYPYNMTYHHALCVTGQTANGATFRLHDPIYNVNVPESYYVSADNIMVGLNNYIA